MGKNPRAPLRLVAASSDPHAPQSARPSPDAGRFERWRRVLVRAVDRGFLADPMRAAPLRGRIASSAFPALTQELLLVAALAYQTRQLLHHRALHLPDVAMHARGPLATQLRAQEARLARLSTQRAPDRGPARALAPAAVSSSEARGGALEERVHRCSELIGVLEQLTTAAPARAS